MPHLWLFPKGEEKIIILRRANAPLGLPQVKQGFYEFVTGVLIFEYNSNLPAMLDLTRPTIRMMSLKNSLPKGSEFFRLLLFGGWGGINGRPAPARLRF